MTGNEHDRWSEDLAAYMLGALEPGEAAELERHAEGCERCRSEMRWLTAAVEALPEAVERHQPPPRLRERVMTEVRADARAAGVKGAEESFARRAAGWLRAPKAGSRDWRPLAGVTAVALIAVALAGYEIGSGGSGAGSEQQIGFVHPAHGVSAKVVSSGDSGALHLADVQKLPENRVLEAWVRRDGEVEPVKALFVPDGEGNASTTIGNLKGVDLVMVTTEPAGGSKSPTSSPIVEVPIRQ